MTGASKWDHRFLDLARHISTWSKDDSTKVGAVIIGPDREVRSTGYNGFPPRVNDTVPERLARPEKYFWTEHAERNAIYFAAMHGVALKGCTIYIGAVPPLPPCADCVRAIIRAGIVRVVLEMPDPIPERWAANCRVAMTMLDEAGVEVLS